MWRMCGREATPAGRPCGQSSAHRVAASARLRHDISSAGRPRRRRDKSPHFFANKNWYWVFNRTGPIDVLIFSRRRHTQCETFELGRERFLECLSGTLWSVFFQSFFCARVVDKKVRKNEEMRLPRAAAVRRSFVFLRFYRSET